MTMPAQDWADKLADEMMARANGKPERLEALRHEMAEALRNCQLHERIRCSRVAYDAAAEFCRPTQAKAVSTAVQVLTDEHAGDEDIRHLKSQD